MNTYKDSGVNIEAGDDASKRAYAKAKQTFASRQGMIGAPVIQDGGYTGLIDMGDFYLVQNDDGVGTKSMISEQIGQYETLGYDLLAMVPDDSVCSGAEVISITNCFDLNTVEPEKIEKYMEGLKEACISQKIAIVGGEVAEVPDLCKGLIWNATALGIVEKDKVIDGSSIVPGDTIIALPSHGFRSNGLTLARKILADRLGPNWFHKPFFDGTQTWGQAVLAPSKVYHSDILELTGRYKQARIVSIKGIANITGGGLPGNLPRILHGLGAEISLLENTIPEVIRAVMNLGQISFDEALKAWNMGVGMVLVTDEPEKVLSAIKGSYLIGTVTDSGEMNIKQQD